MVRRLLEFLALLSLTCLFGLIAPGAALASHGPPGSRLWGHEGGPNFRQYDVGTDTAVAQCVSPSFNTRYAGRGVVLDPRDQALFYSFNDGVPSYAGDGLIHKASLPPACAPLPSIPFGDGPGGAVEDSIGALDLDPDDGQLWVASYQPLATTSRLYKVDRNTGAILQACSVPSSQQAGNDTLTVAKLSGLPGSGKYLLTDAGEVVTTPSDLLVVDSVTCRIVARYPKAVGMSGIDFESGKLIATDLWTIYDLGAAPFGTVGATMSAGTLFGIEDISLETEIVQPELDHFKCYRARPRGRPTSHLVTLRDQFRTHRARVGRASQLCNPVDKNSEGISSPRAHLVSYRIRPAGKQFPTRRVAVRSQFGRATLRLRRPTRLLVPSSKAAAGKQPAEPLPLIDHFQCYSVLKHRGRVPANLMLEDQFGRELVRVGKPKSFCNQVRKNDQAIQNASGHFTCYRIRARRVFRRRGVVVRNQFGVSRLRVLGRRTVCVPSRKRRLAVRPPGGEKDEGEDVRARERWFYRQRAFPRASIPKRAYQRARRQAAKLPRFPLRRGSKRPRPLGASQAGTKSFAWSSIGPWVIDSRYPPRHAAGRVTALAVQDAKTVYAGAAAGGVWKTTNRGYTWTPVFDDQPTVGSIRSLAIGAITIDPNNSNNVFVGTGEGNFSQDSYYGTGLWRSPDAGASWSKIGGGRFDSCSISDIAVKPGDASTIAVAVVRSGTLAPTPLGETVPCAPSRQGVHVSTDGGTTWSVKAPPPGGAAGAFDLAISPANPNDWFAGMGNGAVLRSKNSGQTWSSVINAPSGRRTQLAISPSRPSTMVAAVETPPTVDLFLSRDGGTSWDNTSLRVPRRKRLCGKIPQCDYDLAVAFPNTGRGRSFYLGAVPLYRYARPLGSSGWSYTQVAKGTHVDVHALAHDPAGDLWIGNDGGVDTLRWTTQGETVLNKSTALPITEFEPGISGDLSQLIGGTQDNGTLRYSGSQSWRQILGGDGGFSASNPPPNRHIIHASQQRFEFRRSADGGATWTDITPTLTAGDAGLFYSPLTNDPGRARILYAGSRTLWRSGNRGRTWTAISPLFPVAAGNAISAIGTGTTTPTTPNTTAYVGFSSGGVRFSSNITAPTPTWTADTFPNVLPNRWVTDLWVNPLDPREAYAAVGGFGTAHLWHTTDGVNWFPADGNHPNTPVNAVAVDTSGPFPIIYTGTDVGVFASGDGGTTWANASTNLPATVVMDLLIDPAKGRLIAATHGRGAYTARLDEAPPFADITPPTAITDPVVARFNVPVQGVSTSNFVLRVAGLPAFLPAEVRCQDSTGSNVDCGTGPVSVAELQPSSALTPGQRYRAHVNLSAPPGGITDMFGTAVLPTTRGFRASLREQETTPAARYTWQMVTPGPGPLGRDYTRHHLRGATAEFTFNGSQIKWITVAGPDQGTANVFIDNSFVASVDNFAPTTMYNVARSFPPLRFGRHVIRIEPTGLSDPSATDTFVSIDAFQVDDTTPIETPDVTYTWQPDSAFGSTLGYVRSDLGPAPDATATSASFTFRGTGVTWQAVTGPTEGQARVLIDGVDKGVVDNYSATATPTVVARKYSGLSDALHTMTITVLGTQQPASNGTFVSVDGWAVE